MKNPIQSVLIDNREPHWLQRLPFDAPALVTQLKCGDVWVAAADGALLIIERKTAADLLASIGDGRLFEQAAAMVNMSPWSYVAVQGDLSVTRDGRTCANGSETGWQWSAVQGALQTVQELGVAVVYLDDSDREFGRFVVRLAKRDRAAMRAGGVRKPELLHPGMLLLMSLPGIGGDRAKALLEALPSAALALSFLSDLEWPGDVSGIGGGVKAKVRDALGLPVDMKLAVVIDPTGD